MFVILQKWRRDVAWRSLAGEGNLAIKCFCTSARPSY